MSGSDIEQEYENWVYRFRIEVPINCDGKVLIVHRDRCIEGEWEGQVLTLDGWERFAEWESYDITRLPRMGGIQMARERSSMKSLVEQVTAALQADAGVDGKVQYIDN